MRVKYRHVNSSQSDVADDQLPRPARGNYLRSSIAFESGSFSLTIHWLSESWRGWGTEGMIVLPVSAFPDFFQYSLFSFSFLFSFYFVFDPVQFFVLLIYHLILLSLFLAPLSLNPLPFTLSLSNPFSLFLSSFYAKRRQTRVKYSRGAWLGYVQMSWWW